MVSKNTKISRNDTIGQIFTPDYVAEFMVKNSSNFFKANKKNIQDIKVLEPSAGEGIFLKYLEKEFLSIDAFEMDLSLKKMLSNSFPTINFQFVNFLGSHITEKFDLIIGNPPYLGQNYNSEVFQKYVNEYPICEKYFAGNMDLFYYFIHLGIEKLNPRGILSYITTNYWITKSQKTGIKFLKPHILSECYLLQYIDLSSLSIFDGARGQHNCIFVLQKKTEQEKIHKINKEIQITQIKSRNSNRRVDEIFNERIFRDLIQNKSSPYIRRYNSVLTNADLNQDDGWNLIYPKEIKTIVDKIEEYCKVNGRVSVLQDFFIIRNGIILINDSIFILENGKELKEENNEYFIKINDQFIKLSETEKSRLKKVYKSKSIKSYGYNENECIGYMLYFNKSEFNDPYPTTRNELVEIKYPSLTKYINQFKIKLREILVNAKENPEDLFYPRRGSFIRRLDEQGDEKLVDLEPFYDNSQKLFFKYISERNVFGYSNNSYYATSDTYFLWPQVNSKNNYLFMLAYLNSKVVSFLYKAKNITIKRSKTKLERGLSIPNLINFKSKTKTAICKLIEELTSYLIKNTKNDLTHKINGLLDKLPLGGYINIPNIIKFKLKIAEGLKHDNENTIKNTIDTLFFELFQLDENKINDLLNKYYDLSLN
ncbi:MAG: Eco57I restriction-modification methylase domain-containing protein [Promethearchaeota archaeon]|jgi:adenine-specific DNA-methyltransferase